MVGRRPQNDDAPNTFDLVELRKPVEGHRPGERGTVVLAGPGHVMVDFAWRDGPRPHRAGDTVDVPLHALTVVRRRTPGEWERHREGEPDR
jgi:hypothetical protein